MKDYALIKLEESGPEFIRWVDAPTQVKEGYKIVPVELLSKPSYDDKTQTLTKKETVLITKYKVEWVVKNLPEVDLKRIAFEDAVENGYDTGNGYKLGLKDSDRAAFNEMLALQNLAVRKSLKQSSDLIEIADIEGNLISMSIEEFETLMLQYGDYFIQIWNSSK